MMKDIFNLVQTTLDTLLITQSESIYSFWGRRAEISNEQETEYVIYSFEDDSAEVSADAKLYYRTALIAVQYYIKYSVARTYVGRQTAADRMDSIREVLRSAGFGCTGGWNEIGDVDDVGYATFRATFSIPHLMEA